METGFLLAGAQRRARERPRSATRRSERNKADRHAPTVSDLPHAGDMRDGEPTPQPISNAVFDKGPHEMRHAPPLARFRANGRYKWVVPKDERCCVFRAQTTGTRVAEHRPEIAGRQSDEAMETACPRDRHPHGRRQPDWLRAQHRARSALPKGQPTTKLEESYRSFDNRPRGVMAVRLSGVRRVISIPSEETAASTNSVFFKTPPSASTQVVLSPSSRVIEPS